MYEAGCRSFKVLSRFRIAVRCQGEFLVFGCVKGKRVALLGPASVSDRGFDYRDSRGRFSSIEVDAAAPWSAEVFTNKSEEDLDHTPVAVPVSAAPPSLSEQVRELVQMHISHAAAEQGLETLEEANDFEVDDDEGEIVLSGYEVYDMADDELAAGPVPEDEPVGPAPGEESVPEPPEGAGSASSTVS